MGISNLDPPQPLDDAALVQLFKNSLDLKFHLRWNRFEANLPGQAAGVFFSDDQILALLANTLAQSNQVSAQLMQPRSLHRLLARLKALCAHADHDPGLGLQNFLTRRLIRQSASDVTSMELLHAYREFAGVDGGLALSAYEFHRRLPPLIHTQFGLIKLHEIPRPDASGRLTERNGWRGLKLTDGAEKP